MFEKEAEEYKDTYFGFADERISEVQDFEGNYIDISERIMKTFIDGAEFGYNKGNDEVITEAKEIIKNLLILKNDHYGNTKMEWRVEVTERAEQFLKENK